jgi:hypothetical protein
MPRIKRLWMPVLLGVILVAALVGAASAKPNARPQQQAWRVLTIPAATCDPDDDSNDWSASVANLQCDVGWCDFYCAVDFPAAGEQAVGAINVRRVTMYAYDNNIGAGDYARVRLHKTYPPSAGAVEMAVAFTGDASTDDPWVVMDTSIVGNPVFRTQGPVLEVMAAATDIRVYGFFIHYTW